jgi:hypothetical protein
MLNLLSEKFGQGSRGDLLAFPVQMVAVGEVVIAQLRVKHGMKRDPTEYFNASTIQHLSAC